MPDGTVFLPSYYEAIKDMPDKDRLEAYDAVIRYGLYGEIIEMTPYVKSLFILMKPNIDSSQKRYRASKENGKKGGRPAKNQTENQTVNQPTNQDIDSEKDNDSEINIDFNCDKDYETKSEREEESARGEERTTSPYKPPTKDAFEKMREQQIAKLRC